MILNCVVIDDDPEALNQITSHIKRTPTLQLIGAYTSAREAVRDVRNGHVDVLYLAIQMPELSGIEFARLVPESCRLVFTTAYKEYAFDGIKAGAADYLLKPISFEDFQESYKRVRATFDEYQLQDPIERDRCLVAKVENKFVRIDLDDILYIESMNDYVRFHLTQGRKVTTFSNLKRLESRLPRQQFKRIHRSFIANLCRMDSIGHMRIYYGETSIPISDSYKDAVYQFVNSHLAKGRKFLQKSLPFRKEIFLRESERKLWRHDPRGILCHGNPITR